MKKKKLTEFSQEREIKERRLKEESRHNLKTKLHRFIETRKWDEIDECINHNR